jgi:subtilisin family serine protease
MKMKILCKWLIFLVVNFIVYAQEPIVLRTNDIISIPEEFVGKIGSGELIKIASEKQLLLKRNPTSSYSAKTIQVVIYLDQYPSTADLDSFRSVGLNCIENSWTPPVYDHPFGFILADLNFVKKIDSAEQLSLPQNNEADRLVNADDVWLQGWTGDGVKVAVLDSGLDTEPLNPDLPSLFVKKDYSAYPTLDDDVENQVTGHGTHVTGSVLGRGVLSNGNDGNGGSPYRGLAPSADLVFLKIGNDDNGGARTIAIVNAMDAAVNIYNVDIISMSYGGWDPYHDGSSTKDQKVDWCYSQGVPVFLAAGNDGSSARHFSGIVEGNSQTGFIQVDVTDALEESTTLYFNMVWFDGLGIHNNLNLKYYDESFQQITDSYDYWQTESTRGTESVYSHTLFKVPAGSSVYYLKVVNTSTSSQPFHIYEVYNDGKVSFANPDPNYTIVSPATATYGFCVGAFNSRVEWNAYNGSVYSFNEIQNEIMSFSSRGPRIDGLQKPDIVAPGSAIISIRDRDVLTAPDLYWIDNDGNTTGDADYYVMQGTSMAAPQCAGAAALFLNKYPDATPLDLYNALRDYSGADECTGTVPNSTYGFGKLDIYATINSSDPLPVELTSFSAIIKEGAVLLNWRTDTEVNNYGFEVQRSTRADKWDVLGFVEGHGNSNSPKEYNFKDIEINSAGIYSYRLKQIDNDGSYEFSKTIEVNLNVPSNFELSQNYPNPFNPSTNIKFALPEKADVVIAVYNSLGEKVAEAFNGELEEGYHEVVFSAIGGSASGGNVSTLPSGVYFYRFESEQFFAVKKMLLIK